MKQKMPYIENIISIHAPREGVRQFDPDKLAKALGISIHAPREGVRQMQCCWFSKTSYFNPRTPRGGATVKTMWSLFWVGISIHAPREGVRRGIKLDRSLIKQFQSTHPARGCDFCC